MSDSSLTASELSSLHGVVRCDRLGVIRAVGEEAAKFLHGQLTHDVVLLDTVHARLASFCSSKGRMQASFVVFKRSAEEIFLVCDAALLPTTLKRLSMFVMRAKAKLSDASAEVAVWGLAGSAVPTDLPAEPWSMTTEPNGAHVVRLYPGEGVSRALWVAPVDTAAPQGPALTPANWAWLEVMSGVAPVTAPIVEAFVPQMLNHESVGGVNFKKGCYPGQEVVARSQFRGSLKRRAYRVACPEALSVGQEVFHDSDPGQPCGLVAAAAAHPAGGWSAIVSMQTQAASDGHLHAGSVSGPELQLLALPYPLLDDI
ncbi:folate-binding protein YgfZ [Hydrogenophaga sp. PAMC20947]|uniref:CAF17-like 4Fe-4S cluster assembly/insertion protein YgfZ n=1 Tax=Hydrogenophaga sp. PAMC20947 TaxID=2565558 RepID=UPI00109E1ADA|nr:folate-binding protein YgfZ [Hydrogenophaga sp. PAMC20947]QCB45584.1 folate-binding protein [Hydrogenophaga sp. PAMC20947]